MKTSRSKASPARKRGPSVDSLELFPHVVPKTNGRGGSGGSTEGADVKKPERPLARRASGKAAKTAAAETYASKRKSTRAGVAAGKAGNWVVIARAASDALELTRACWQKANQMRLEDVQAGYPFNADQWRALLEDLRNAQEILRRGIKGIH